MSDPIADRTLAGFDLETTGPDPSTARAIEAAVLVAEPDGATFPMVADRILHDPPVDVPQGATDVHGITTADLDDAPPAREILGLLLEALTSLSLREIPVVIYNAAYDLGVLAAELDRYNLGHLPALTIVDPLVCDRWHDRYRKGSRKLVDVATHYGIPLDDAHAAAADVAASIGVAREIDRRYGLPTDRQTLHTAQAAAYREWAHSFAAYLRKIGADRPPPDLEWINPQLLNPQETDR